MPSMRGIVPELADEAHRRMHCQPVMVDMPADSHPRDAAKFGQALPRQAQHQSVELRGRERQGRRDAGGDRPDEATGVQAPRRAPHAEAVVNEQLDARAARIREEVAVMGLGDSEHLHHARQQPLGAGSHVDGLGGQPHRIDADHRSSSRIQAAHSLAALAGHVTVTVVAPRCSSMRMSGNGVGVAGEGSDTGTNDGAVVGLLAVTATCALSSSTDGLISTSVTQRRRRLAFTPLAMATAAMEMPGCVQAATRSALNSSLCRRRR